MVTVEASTRSAGAILADCRDEFSPALHAAVETLPASMRRIADYHLGWRDERGHPIDEPAGKAIRPALTLVTAAALGARPGAAVHAAVAVELVHNFSLLHDDVMDGDLTRRHRPTAWTVFGANAAILAGDALLTLAFDVLHHHSGDTATSAPFAAGAPFAPPAGPGAPVVLGDCVHRLLDGQSADLSFEDENRVDPADCVRMSEAKTGALLGCACALGALSAGAAPQDVDRLRTFGERVGLAFQFVDDLLGIWGDPAVTGKPVHSDLANRKKSLPVVRALATEGPAAEALTTLYHRTDPLSPPELAEAAALIEATGAREWSLHQVDHLLRQALLELPGSAISDVGAAELTALAELMTHREH